MKKIGMAQLVGKTEFWSNSSNARNRHNQTPIELKTDKIKQLQNEINNIKPNLASWNRMKYYIRDNLE